MLHDGDRPTPRGLFAPARVPAVRRLHLARETATTEIYGLLGTIAIAPQLTHVVVPSLPSRRDVDLVQAAIDRMPLLREVTVARAYTCFDHLRPELAHPYARIRMPESWPWRPPDRYRYEPLRIDGVVPRTQVRDNDDLRWVARDELGDLGIPAPIRRLIESIF